MSYLTPNLIKQCLRDQYMQNTFARLSTLSRLSIYCQCKHDYCFVKHLDIYIFTLCSSLLNLRCGILNKNIELGRFDNTPREQRICPVCNMNAIENEYHFILVCPYYKTSERNTKGNIIVRGLRLMCIILLSIQSKQKMLQLAKYIYDSIQRRQT